MPRGRDWRRRPGCGPCPHVRSATADVVVRRPHWVGQCRALAPRVPPTRGASRPHWVIQVQRFGQRNRRSLCLAQASPPGAGQSRPSDCSRARTRVSCVISANRRCSVARVRSAVRLTQRSARRKSTSRLPASCGRSAARHCAGLGECPDSAANLFEVEPRAAQQGGDLAFVFLDQTQEDVLRLDFLSLRMSRPPRRCLQRTRRRGSRFAVHGWLVLGHVSATRRVAGQLTSPSIVPRSTPRRKASGPGARARASRDDRPLRRRQQRQVRHGPAVFPVKTLRRVVEWELARPQAARRKRPGRTGRSAR